MMPMHSEPPLIERVAITGFEASATVMRRDPSDIILSGGRYYIWYTKGRVAHGYDSTIWYATSADGLAWEEQGEALPRGPEGAWDAQSVFTPNILVAQNRYWLFYTAVPKPFINGGNRVTKTAIGVAVSDAPDGPWTKLDTNPILRPSDDPARFDSMRVDDTVLLVRGGRYWLYYKGRQWDRSWQETKLGVAIADQPQGPYVKYEKNPVVPAGHEVMVWPVGDSVMAMINIGPKPFGQSLQQAPDGVTFTKVQDLDRVPHAAGFYLPEAHTDSGKGRPPEWGLEIIEAPGCLPTLGRFNCIWK
jgi:predicted GH43/DUF377 family glycosyl hydrolase